jgi:hypothetical protein
VTVEVRPTHFVSCWRLTGGQQCCSSCHDDEDEGYDTLYIENTEVAPGVSVGVVTCCAASDRVYERVRKMTTRLGGSGKRW